MNQKKKQSKRKRRARTRARSIRKQQAYQARIGGYVCQIAGEHEYATDDTSPFVLRHCVICGRSRSNDYAWNCDSATALHSKLKDITMKFVTDSVQDSVYKNLPLTGKTFRETRQRDQH